jgi:hypothetical protein
MRIHARTFPKWDMDHFWRRLGTSDRAGVIKIAIDKQAGAERKQRT